MRGLRRGGGCAAAGPVPGHRRWVLGRPPRATKTRKSACADSGCPVRGGGSVGTRRDEGGNMERRWIIEGAGLVPALVGLLGAGLLAPFALTGCREQTMAA